MQLEYKMLYTDNTTCPLISGHAQITEHTATVTHILGVVTETWGPGYVLVTVDGLTIEDSDGTRGILLISIRLYDQVLISVMYLLVIYVTS